MHHEGKGWGNPELYPRWGDSFKPEVNINIKGQGTLEYGKQYIINGAGWGYPNEEGERRELWVIVNKYNTEQPPLHIWKDDLEKLYDTEKITVIV